MLAPETAFGQSAAGPSARKCLVEAADKPSLSKKVHLAGGNNQQVFKARYPDFRVLEFGLGTTP